MNMEMNFPSYPHTPQLRLKGYAVHELHSDEVGFTFVEMLDAGLRFMQLTTHISPVTNHFLGFLDKSLPQ